MLGRLLPVVLASAWLGLPAAAAAAPPTAASFGLARVDHRDDGRIVACAYTLDEFREVRSFARARATPAFRQAVGAARSPRGVPPGALRLRRKSPRPVPRPGSSGASARSSAR